MELESTEAASVPDHNHPQNNGQSGDHPGREPPELPLLLKSSESHPAAPASNLTNESSSHHNHQNGPDDDENNNQRNQPHNNENIHDSSAADNTSLDHPVNHTVKIDEDNRVTNETESGHQDLIMKTGGNPDQPESLTSSVTIVRNEESSQDQVSLNNNNNNNNNPVPLESQVLLLKPSSDSNVPNDSTVVASTPTLNGSDHDNGKVEQPDNSHHHHPNHKNHLHQDHDDNNTEEDEGGVDGKQSF